MNVRLMESCLKEEGVLFSAEQMVKLASYDTLLRRYNPLLKMVKAEGDEFIVRHYADSLVAVNTLSRLLKGRQEPTVADLGSGAGLPGIPLAIAFPSVRFALVERMEKRADFLSLVVRVAGLSNVRVVRSRLREIEERYEIVTCRAFHPFYDIEDEVSSVLAPGGAVMLYKGRAETIEKEMAQVRGQWTFNAFHVHVPFLDAERVLCVGRKKEGRQ